MFLPKQLLFLASNLFYIEMKSIVEWRHTVLYKAFHGLESLLLCCAALRGANILVALIFRTSQCATDPHVNYLLRHAHLYDVYAMLCAVAFVVFTIAVELVIYYYSYRTITLQLGHDLIVTNFEIYRRCLKDERHQRQMHREAVEQVRSLWQSQLPALCFQVVNIFEPVFKILGFVSNLWNLDYVDKYQMCYRYKLKIFNTISANLRLRLIQVLMACNYIMAGCLGSSVFVMAGFYYIIYPDILAPFPSPNYLHLLVDNLLLLTILGVMYRNCLIIFFVGIFSSYPIQAHLKECNALLSHILRLSSKSLNNYDHIRLRYYLIEHVTKTNLLIRNNKQMIAPMIFTTMLLAIPSNIYLLYRVIYTKAILAEKLVTLELIIGELLALAVVLLPMASCTETIYNSKRLLPAIQFCLSNLKFKLKYDNFYWQLVDEKKHLAYSFGPVKSITYRALMEFSLNYGVYLTCLFSLLLHL